MKKNIPQVAWWPWNDFHVFGSEGGLMYDGIRRVINVEVVVDERIELRGRRNLLDRWCWSDIGWFSVSSVFALKRLSYFGEM